MGGGEAGSVARDDGHGSVQGGGYGRRGHVATLVRPVLELPRLAIAGFQVELGWKVRVHNISIVEFQAARRALKRAGVRLPIDMTAVVDELVDVDLLVIKLGLPNVFDAAAEGSLLSADWAFPRFVVF